MALHVPTKHKKLLLREWSDIIHFWTESFFLCNRADFSTTNMCLRRIMLDMVRTMLDLYDKMLKMRRISFSY